MLAAYPLDRVRRKAECLGRIREALDAGTEVEDLLQAVKAYAIESAGFTRWKVCFSDKRFKSGWWRAYVKDIARSREEAKVKQAGVLAVLAGWAAERVSDLLCICDLVHAS